MLAPKNPSFGKSSESLNDDNCEMFCRDGKRKSRIGIKWELRVKAIFDKMYVMEVTTSEKATRQKMATGTKNLKLYLFTTCLCNWVILCRISILSLNRYISVHF